MRAKYGERSNQVLAQKSGGSSSRRRNAMMTFSRIATDTWERHIEPD